MLRASNPVPTYCGNKITHKPPRKAGGTLVMPKRNTRAPLGKLWRDSGDAQKEHTSPPPPFKAVEGLW